MKSADLQTYRRLLGFTKPYRFRLYTGLLMGVLAGGSLFGILQFLPVLLAPFEQKIQDEAVATVRPREAVPPPDRAAAPTVKEDKILKQAKLPLFGEMEKLAARLGIPVTTATGAMAWQFVAILIVTLPLVMLARGFLIFLSHYYIRWVGARTIVDIRSQLFDRLMNQSLGFFGRSNIGHLMSRCTNDTTLVEHSISSSVADLVEAPIQILTALLFIIYFSVKQQMLGFLVAMLVVLPLCLMPMILLGRRIKNITNRAMQRISDLVSCMQEIFTGIRVVKAFHTETEESGKFHRQAHTYFSTVIKSLRLELMMPPATEFIGVLCLCVFLVYCYASDIRISQIVPIGGAAYMCYRPFKVLAKLNTNLNRGIAAAERVFEIIDTETKLPERPNPVRLAQFSGQIEFDQVNFSYDLGTGTPVLTDIAFTLPRGHVAAFVGRTGSGKSTIANLLARFYDPTGGAIRMDGVDLRDAEVASLRRLIGIVTQETILFNDTIANNIRYGSPTATLEQVMAAAQKANAHEFIMAEPEGYDRVVGDKGFRLSGGQRQRIAIARAILRNPPILILDEATSALDTVTEKLVQDALYRLMSDRTVLVIAHRLSTIRRANCIYVLEDGRIAERGTHEQLLACGGAYRALSESLGA